MIALRPARLTEIRVPLPDAIAAVLAYPYLYLNRDLSTAEKSLTVNQALNMVAGDITEKIIRR